MKYCINDNEVKISKSILGCSNCLFEEKPEMLCFRLNICSLHTIIVNSENTSPIFIL